MFGKLMKYEMRYLIRIFAPMWVIVLALCTFSRLTIRPDLDGMMYMEGIQALLPVLAIMLAVTAIITMMIVATVVLLQRFYKGMYGDEGYLMFTLPVTTGSLIHSKALSAVVMMVVSALVTWIGVLIMVSYPQIWGELDMNWSEMFQMVLEMNGLSGLEPVALAFWVVIAGVMSMVQGIYLIYFAISIGQLWKKHPVMGAIGAYYVLSLVASFSIGGLGNTKLENIMNHFVTADLEYGALLAIILIAATLYCLLWTVISFFGTKLILDRKLNIQ